MAKNESRPETKLSRDLATVLDFLNADFRKSGKRGKWAVYALNYLSLLEAREIQKAMLESYDSGGTTEALLDATDKYADRVAWRNPRLPNSKELDRRKLQALRDISKAGSDVVLFCIHVINDGRFWRLRRCAQCSNFFSPHRKQLCCSDKCLRERESKTAQERVEKARKMRRWDEMFPQLVKLQKMRDRPFSDVYDKVPGFDPKLLAMILERQKPLKELAMLIKYRNRRILLEAKL
jgi:hypothetical protein